MIHAMSTGPDATIVGVFRCAGGSPQSTKVASLVATGRLIACPTKLAFTLLRRWDRKDRGPSFRRRVNAVPVSLRSLRMIPIVYCAAAGATTILHLMASARGCRHPVASSQYLREASFTTPVENLRGVHLLKVWFQGDFTVAGIFANARVSSCPVSARICRDWAAARTRLDSAFIRVIDVFRRSSRAMAR